MMEQALLNQYIPYSQEEVVEIPLTKGYVAIVNSCDADLAELKWQAAIDKQTVYGIRTVWYPDGSRTTIRLHRVVMERVLAIRLTTEQKVDHRNGCGLDNRRTNLRLASSVENTRNRACQRNSTSGIRGVSWHKETGKWRARITLNGRCISLGYYDDLAEAAKVRRDAELEYFGEFSFVASRGQL